MTNELKYLENDFLRISAICIGAELQSVYDKKEEIELLWQGDSKYWGRRAPVLFPIVGRLKNDKLIHHKTAYTMTQHGFARDSEFEVIYQDDTQLEFRLRANDLTKSYYPFDFELIVAYSLDANVLTISYVIRSDIENELPFSIGGHPAFNWPLIPDVDKEKHELEFQCNETNHVRQLQDGLLKSEKYNSPVNNRKLQLKDSLFENDALIFDEIKNRKVIYKAGDSYIVSMKFEDFPQFGVWTKPGAPFICLEPWYGYASPVDYADELVTKPGIIILPEHGEMQLSYSITING